MFKRTQFLSVLLALTVGVSPVLVANSASDTREWDRRGFIMYNLALGAALTAITKGSHDAISFGSREMVGVMLNEALSKTSLKDYSVPLVIATLHGKQIIKFGVNSFKGGLAFREHYKKRYKTTNGWFTAYMKQLRALTAKQAVVGVVMNNVSNAAEAVGIGYPEWVKNNWFLLGFAMQVPMTVQDGIAKYYDHYIGNKLFPQQPS